MMCALEGYVRCFGSCFGDVKTVRVLLLWIFFLLLFVL